jgi:hypothetical protein
MKKTLGYLLLESFLIAFGVCIGFGLDRYREYRSDIETKKQLYKELASDLAQTKAYMESVRDEFDTFRKRFAYFKDFVETGKAVPDTFMLNLVSIEYYPNRPSVKSTYTSIVNSGRIILFEKDSTFKKVQSVYLGFDFIEAFSLVSKGESSIQSYLTPLINKNGDRPSFNGELGQYYFDHPPKVNFVAFRNREFLNFLQKFESQFWDGEFFDYNITMCEAVLSEIEQVSAEL